MRLTSADFLLFYCIVFNVFVSVLSLCRQNVNCKLPKCFCPTNEHFLGSQNIPQIVYFAIDDDVSETVAHFFRRLFHQSRTNPNGCPITGTFFISHECSDFKMIQSYYENGFEIASHSNANLANKDALTKGILDERGNITSNTNIPETDIIGWRSGYLKTVGDDQIEVLKDFGYKYDISLTYIRRPAYPPANTVVKRSESTAKNLFPMTTDYPWVPRYPCNIPPCYSRNHSNFWQVPLNVLYDHKDQYPCNYLDGCHNRPRNVSEAYYYLSNNFNNSYYGNRAPFGIHMRGRSLNFEHFYYALDTFITDILTLPDVYIVPVSKTLSWMESPKTISEIKRFGFDPWKCPYFDASAPLPPLPPLPALPKPTTPPPPMKPCTQGDNCRLPDCFCKTFEHPDLPRPNISQIVYFGFDDELDYNAYQYLETLFPLERTNPNNCSVSYTLFVMDKGTDYNLVQNLYRRGVEIASHSIDHPSDITTKEQVERHAMVQKQNLAAKSGIPLTEIVGWRSPFLKTVGDTQATVLQGLGYTYDASYTFIRRPIWGRPDESNKNVWPFTADFGWGLPCNIPPCVWNPHKGFWFVPVNAMWYNGTICSFADFCDSPVTMPTEQDVFQYLMDNFDNSYYGNRAPFGVHLHARWFKDPKNLRAVERFLDEILSRGDVYVISIKQMLDWMKSPTDMTTVDEFLPWQCFDKSDTPVMAAFRSKPPVRYRISFVTN